MNEYNTVDGPKIKFKQNVEILVDNKKNEK